MQRADAARLWAQIERALIEARVVSSDTCLRVTRAKLIRLIGEQVGEIGDSVAGDRAELPLTIDLPPAAGSVEVPARALRGKALERKIDQTLEYWLNRSCSLRGYSGDDVV